MLYYYNLKQQVRVMKNQGNATSFRTHKHALCVTSALQAAEMLCAKHKLRLTPVRRRVLEVLLEHHRAMGAYDVLDRLRAEGFGSQPPVAYRALDFWVEAGLVHKIQKLNAFVACAHPSSGHDPVFMICRGCETVAEGTVDPDDSAVKRAASAAGFQVETTVREVEGLCPKCQKGTPQ